MASPPTMPTSLPDQLRTTIRFLGRVLGDVIRAEDGEAVFNQIEETRRASVAFHRQGTGEAAKVMAERAAIDRELVRQFSIYMRTRLVPSVKLGVSDEIENAVSYFELSFLPELPRLYPHWVDVLGRTAELTSFLRVGSWVGGDRDG